MKAKPETDNERAWYKYLKRAEIEKNAGDSLHQHFQLIEDTFYSRAQAKELRKSMFGLVNENHKQGMQ